MLTYFLLLTFSSVLLSLDLQKELSPNWVVEQNRDPKEMLEDLDPNKVMGFEDVVMRRDPDVVEVGDLEARVIRNLKANSVGDLEANVVKNLEANEVADLEVDKERKSAPSDARAEEHARILQEVFQKEKKKKNHPLHPNNNPPKPLLIRGINHPNTYLSLSGDRIWVKSEPALG